MTSLADIRRELSAKTARQAMPAPIKCTLEPSYFCDEYDGKPKHSIEVGLRSPIESDIEAAISTAEKEEDERERNRIMMRELVCSSLCHVSDVSRAHPSFPTPNEIIDRALKPETIRYLWDQIERYRVATSPIFQEIENEELGELLALLETDSLSELDPVIGSRVRRYLRFCLEDLRSG